MSAIDLMESDAKKLVQSGFKVTTPRREEATLDWSALSLNDTIRLKRAFLTGYFETIATADIVVIANTEKLGISGYIGANTLMEAACGHTLGKPVVFLNPPGEQACRLEALAISAGCLDGDVMHLCALCHQLREGQIGAGAY